MLLEDTCKLFLMKYNNSDNIKLCKIYVENIKKVQIKKGKKGKLPVRLNTVMLFKEKKCLN